MGRTASTSAYPSDEAEVLESTGHGDGDIEGSTIADANDPRLRLTDIGGISTDDRATDTGLRRTQLPQAV